MTELVGPHFFNDPIMHWYRNVFSHVRSTKVREVAAMLKASHQACNMSVRIFL
jgi:hypothetical protein